MIRVIVEVERNTRNVTEKSKNKENNMRYMLDKNEEDIAQKYIEEAKAAAHQATKNTKRLAQKRGVKRRIRA